MFFTGFVKFLDFLQRNPFSSFSNASFKFPFPPSYAHMIVLLRLHSLIRILSPLLGRSLYRRYREFYSFRNGDILLSSELLQCHPVLSGPAY